MITSTTSAWNWTLTSALILLMLAAPAILHGQERLGRQRQLDRAQVEAIRSQIEDRAGRAVIGFKRASAFAGMRPDGTPALSPAQVSNIATRLAPLGVVVRRQYHLIPAAAVTLDPNRIEQLLARPDIDYVEPDYVYELVDSTPTAVMTAQGALDQQTPWGVERIGAPNAWATTRGAGAKVGIMDTGIDEDHPDLSVLGGVNFVTDSTGRSDWDDDSPQCRSHGTHVAGTVAALDNTVAVVGVAPQAELYALRIFDPLNAGFIGCLAAGSDIIKAIEWAADNNLDVINMSFGNSFPSLAQGDAMFAAYSAGVVPIAAAGNNAGPVIFPAAFPNAIAVSALNDDDQLASFSSFGPEVEVAGPGVLVPSTVNDGTINVKSGTSMASPHAAGVATLIRAARPGLSVDDVRQILRNTAEDLFDPGFDDDAGWGIVDAASAVNAVGSSSFALSFVPGDLTLALEPTAGPVTRSVELRNVGAAGTIGWTAAADMAWITPSPSSGSASDAAPGQLDVTVDPTGLDFGPRTGFVTVTGNAVNSPAQLRVQLSVVERVPLDATASTVRALEAGQRLRYLLRGSAGQRIDVALLSDPDHPQPLGDPFLRVYKPDGVTLLAVNDDQPFAGLGRQSLVFDLELPEDGEYQVEVSSLNETAAGGFILKARLSGPILGFSPAVRDRFFMAAEDGGASATFELALSNLSGIGNITWSAMPSDPWLSLSPSSGAPSNVTVTADPTSLATGEHSGSLSFQTSDGWLSPDYGIFFWVFTSGMQTISSGHLRPWGMTADDTAAVGIPAPVIVATQDNIGELRPIEPDGTVGNPLITGFNSRPGGVTLGRDGNWYVGSRDLDNKIVKVTRSGEASNFATLPSTPYWLTTGPGGDFYATLCDIDRVYRVSRDGLSVEPFGPEIPCPSGITFSHDHERIYVAVGDGAGVEALRLDGSPSGILAAAVDSPAALVLGRSGALYVTGSDGRIWTADLATGNASLFALAPAPTALSGVALAEGALMMAGTGTGGLYRFAVDDGPIGVRPPGGEITARMSVEGIDTERGVPFELPLRLDVTASELEVSSYSIRIEWPPNMINFAGGVEGDFGGSFQETADSSDAGVLRIAATRNDGAGGQVLTLYTPTFSVGRSVLPGSVFDIEIEFVELQSPTSGDVRLSLAVERARICVNPWPYGDVTTDSEVSAADATQILRELQRQPLAGDTDLRWGDVNADGRVGYADVSLILRHVTGESVPRGTRANSIGVGQCMPEAVEGS